jgi:hypothetical protein
VDTYHEEASRKGLRIVPCCGFDSTPFDLGALLVVNHMRERLGKKPAKVLNVVLGSKGGVSGGTIARSVSGTPGLACPPACWLQCPGGARACQPHRCLPVCGMQAQTGIALPQLLVFLPDRRLLPVCSAPALDLPFLPCLQWLERFQRDGIQPRTQE